MRERNDEDPFTIPELVEKNYPVKVLREIARSEDFWRCGFKCGRVAYFWLPKLKEELTRREKANV